MLSALSLGSGVTLDPEFADSVTTYTAEVGHDVTSVTVTATASDANAAVAITLADDDDDADQSNGRSVDLDVGATAITAMVTSEDASDTTNYMVTVTRAHAVVTMSASPNPVAEGGEATVTASVDHAQDSAFTVTVMPGSGGSVPSDANTLTFAANATDATGSVTVTATDNDERNTEAQSITVKGNSSEDAVMVDSLVIAVTDDELVASAPRNLDATPGDQTATVTWTGPSSIGSMPITAYDWELTAPATAPRIGQVTDLSTLSVSLADLVNGVTYTFTVHAVSDLGDGESASTSVKAQPGVTLAPTTATIAEAGTDSVEVTFTLSNPTREAVTVTVAADSAHLVSIQDAVLVIEAGTRADTTYVWAKPNVFDGDRTVMVSATADNATDPADTLAVSITDDDDAVPSAPRGLVANVGDEALTLEWTSPAEAGTSDITHYQYRISDEALDDDDEWVTVVGGATARNVTISDLENDTTYNIEVRAVSAAGNGASATITGTPSS